MTFDELKQQFIDNGFRVEENTFINEFEDPNTVINGVHPVKRFMMEYTGEGSIYTATDDSDSDSDIDEEVIYQFDVIGQNKRVAFSICIKNFEDFTKLV